MIPPRRAQVSSLPAQLVHECWAPAKFFGGCLIPGACMESVPMREAIAGMIHVWSLSCFCHIFTGTEGQPTTDLCTSHSECWPFGDCHLISISNICVPKNCTVLEGKAGGKKIWSTWPLQLYTFKQTVKPRLTNSKNRCVSSPQTSELVWGYAEKE